MAHRPHRRDPCRQHPAQARHQWQRRRPPTRSRSAHLPWTTGHSLTKARWCIPDTISSRPVARRGTTTSLTTVGYHSQVAPGGLIERCVRLEVDHGQVEGRGAGRLAVDVADPDGTALRFVNAEDIVPWPLHRTGLGKDRQVTVYHTPEAGGEAVYLRNASTTMWACRVGRATRRRSGPGFVRCRVGRGR
jgi:hypothetical protein